MFICENIDYQNLIVIKPNFPVSQFGVARS